MKPLHEVDYPIEPLLRQRWSPRAFDTRPIEPARAVCTSVYDVIDT
jgi:hypothetical protein